ncbi:MAG: hypothetical protein R6X21_02700 [Candidatus Aminicenantes bacterium]
MENIARAALFVELVVSWTVWSHPLKFLFGGLLGFALAFFLNIVMTVGLKGVLGIFQPSELKTKDLLPTS